MSAQLKSRRDEVAEHILNICKIRAKRIGCRIKKLTDNGARESVINAAAWRLMRSDASFGNIRDYIEQSFLHEDVDTRNKLIDRALDAERQAYLRASEASGGTAAGELLDPSAWDWQPNLSYRDEPTFVIEQQGAEAEEVAADDARAKIEAEENARLQQAVAVYERKLRRQHREALRLVCGPRLPNGVIAARCSVAERTVAKIRADVCDIADGILTNPEDAVETLLRKVETLEKEMAVIKAERRRDAFLRDHSIAEYEALRAWATPWCEALGQSVDELLGATIVPNT